MTTEKLSACCTEKHASPSSRDNKRLKTPTCSEAGNTGNWFPGPQVAAFKRIISRVENYEQILRLLYQ